MSGLVVADTSVFIEYLRGAADQALAVLILKNRVLLSPMVRLELMAGVRKAELKPIERLCNALRPIEDFSSPPSEGLKYFLIRNSRKGWVSENDCSYSCNLFHKFL